MRNLFAISWLHQSCRKQLHRPWSPHRRHFAASFRRLNRSGLHPFSEVSGTVRTVHVEKGETFPDEDIRILDTRQTGANLATMEKIAVGMAEQGTEVPIYNVGASISTHAGTGVLKIAFFSDRILNTIYGFHHSEYLTFENQL